MSVLMIKLEFVVHLYCNYSFSLEDTFLFYQTGRLQEKKKKSPLKFQDLPFGYAFSRGAVIKL